MKNGDVVSVVEDIEENMYSDDGLVFLMFIIEWMVKVVGYLCLIVRQFGDMKVLLKFFFVFRVDVNFWIVMRNKIWVESNEN